MDSLPPRAEQLAMKPQGDPSRAVAAEYREAMSSGDPARLLLFIQRHPTDPLAARAAAEWDRLLRRDPRRQP